MVNTPTPKTAVKLVREAFAQRGSSIPAKDAYDLVAQLWGYRDWPTAKASLDKAPAVDAKKTEPKFAHTDQDIANWPVWVFCNKGNNPDEDFYVYPQGTKLDDLYSTGRGPFLIDDGDRTPVEMDPKLMDGLPLALSDAFVGESIACEYWDADRYGFPSCANEREAHAFLKEELGWGYLALPGGYPVVDVTAHSRGDDGMVEWWVQARVHPLVHERLVRSMGNLPERQAFEQSLQEVPTRKLFSQGQHPKDSDLQSMACAQLVSKLGGWFEKVGDYSLIELLKVLTSYHPEKLAREILPPGFELYVEVNSATAGSLAEDIRKALEMARKEFYA